MPTEFEPGPEVPAEAGALVATLRAVGWRVTASRYDAQSFGNWFVDLERDDRAIRLVKDRSQFMIEGQTDELRAAGLLKPFDRLGSFCEAVVAWVDKQGA